MENRSPWYADRSVQDAVRQFILALIILGLALLGYDVQLNRQPPAEAPAAVEAMAARETGA